MAIMIRRWQTAVGILMILFLATACFQNVGDEAGGQQISLQITSTPTETPTEEPTSTPTPTEEPEETIEVEQVDDEDDAVDLPIADNPTATETETATPTATETETEVPEVAQAGDSDGSGLGQLLQATDTDDPFEMTATSLVETATAQYLFPTWQAETMTAQAQQIFIPTETPTDSFGGVFATATTSGPILSGADCVHEVRQGETMYRYSVNYGLPVNDIATRNGIVNPNLIIEGQMVIIPGCGTTGAFPPATSTPVATIAFGSGGPSLGGDASVGTGGGCVSQYTVQQYDTLFQISLNYGVAAQSIANANGIANVNRINMGDVLCIPAQ